MTIKWTERATADLFAIGEYIARDDPRAARRWIERLRKRARAAAKLPNTGRMVAELGRPDIREALLRNYRIVYRVVGRGIVVLTAFDS